MKKRIIYGLISLMLFSLAALPAFALQSPTSPVTSIEDILIVLNRAATWLLSVVLVIGVILMIYAGLLWMTAGGDEDKLKTARKYLTWALVGIGVALLAKGLVLLVAQFVGATVTP